MDLQEILTSYQEGFAPAFTGSIYKWAEQYVTLGNGYSITGKFSCDISPHFKDIFHSIQDSNVREVNICASPRSGKTLIGEISLLHTITNNSGDVLYLQLSDEKASQLAELRLIPLVKSCPVAYNLLSSDKYNIQTNKLKFLHSTVHVTSPKPNALNSIGYRFIFADECWKYEQGILKEVKRRSDDFAGINKFICFSQGGVTDSTWHEQFVSGDTYTYGFHCPSCKQLQAYEFQRKREDGTYSGIVWPKECRDTTNGEWIIKQCAKSAKLECHFCRYQIEDNPVTRKQLLDSGTYIKTSTGEDITTKSFRFGNLCNLKISFGELATRFLQARQKLQYFGDTSELQEFTTKDCADFWDESVKKTRVEIRLSEYNPENPYGESEAFRFMAIDCQDSEPFFYYVIRSFTSNGDSRLVNYGKCNTWAELDAIRQRHKVDYRFVGVDSGQGTKTEAIYSECCKRGRWANIGGENTWACFMSLKGSGLKGFMHGDKKWYRYNEPQEYFVSASEEDDNGKSIIHITWSNLRFKSILETLRDGKGKCKWEAADVTEEYTTQLNSEMLQRKLKGKTADFEYVPKPNTPNHFWDCECMCLVMADLYSVLEAAASSDKEETLAA